MNEKQLAEIWLAQGGKLKMENQLMNQVRSEFRREERRVIWLSLQEVVPAVALFLFFGVCAFTMKEGQWAMFTAAALMLGIAVFLIVSLFRQRRKQSVFADTVKGELQRSLSQVKHRQWLFQSIFWWYLLPGVLAWGVIVYEKMIKDGVTPFEIGYLAVACVFFSWVYWANRRYGDRRFSPQRKRFEELLRDFE